MAYDENLAARIRQTLARRKGVTERKMFGGIAFMLKGNMACGILRDQLMLRLGNTGVAKGLKQPYTEPMNFTGKTIKSMILVNPPGYEADAYLKEWLKRALDFTGKLPGK